MAGQGIGPGPGVKAYTAASSTQDFTTFTEVDADGVGLTVASGSVSWTAWDTRTETAYVYKDFTAGYFSGDFTHRFTMTYSGVSGGPLISYWGVANAVGDVYAIQQASGDMIRFGQYTDELRLIVTANGTDTQDVYTATAGTYYVTVARDDDGGANGTGQVTATIRTGSHTGTVVDTLSVDCAVGEQNDYRYLYGASSYDHIQADHTISGSVSDLEIVQ